MSCFKLVQIELAIEPGGFWRLNWDDRDRLLLQALAAREKIEGIEEDLQDEFSGDI